ncbi:maltase A1-like isoform X2 [Homalodisca vitripennis]|uniref:maltase A1-like isoform X2 n=1 Tax=Homalodisca vitripennis TaxID=197043 RepID=UPI001EEA2B12|nr:maltase A1-like isoform X2 [Homalodisca vitripennis]
MRWLWFSCAALAVFSVSALDALEDLPWWKTAVFYQVYPRSFKDSDGDGIGDLKGITQVADYFKEIGVDAIWMNPILKSPMADFGYDISDYTEIDPIFGTMEDFEGLVTKLRDIDVKLVLDFVPNHSSDEHPWFNMSVNRVPGYEDFYVWKDPKYSPSNKTEREPPNNWISVFSGSAWEWNAKRNQYYLHKFLIKQPDLNYREDAVKGNMTAVIEFWLGKGVDGFRMDAVQQIYEDIGFPDELPVNGTKGDTYNTQQHNYEINQPETFTLLKDWADVVYKWVQKDGRQRAIFLEVYDTIPTTMKYYGNGTESLEFPFNFQLLTQGNQTTRPAELKQIIDDWMTAMPSGCVANWVVGNHDNGRVADRYGHEMVDSINLLTGVLPGIKVVYNGEEIGMQNTFIRWDQTVDNSGRNLGPYHYQEGSRDPERTPMQWDDTPSSGFSSNDTTWLPVNPNYWWLNVDAQMSSESSHLKVFQAMTAARKDPVLQRGDYSVLVPNNDTLIVVRNYSESYFALIINMGSEIFTYTSENLFAHHSLDIDMTVVLGSTNSGLNKGTNLKKGSLSVSLRPKAAVLLRSGSSATSSSARLYVTTALLICGLLALLFK